MLIHCIKKINSNNSVNLRHIADRPIIPKRNVKSNVKPNLKTSNLTYRMEGSYDFTAVNVASVRKYRSNCLKTLQYF